MLTLVGIGWLTCFLVFLEMVERTYAADRLRDLET